MKRISTLIAIVLALLLLFGCADSPESEPTILYEEVPDAETSFDFAPSDAYGTLYPFVG